MNLKKLGPVPSRESSRMYARSKQVLPVPLSPTVIIRKALPPKLAISWVAKSMHGKAERCMQWHGTNSTTSAPKLHMESSAKR